MRKVHTESKVVFNVQGLLLWVRVIPCGICRLLAFFVLVERIECGRGEKLTVNGNIIIGSCTLPTADRCPLGLG